MNPPASQETPAPEDRPLKVLVVDDQRSARRVLRSAIESRAGFRSVEASSLTQARAALAAEPFDVALVDVRLEADIRDRSGLTLIGEIRATTQTTPIVVSAAGGMEQIRAAMRL